LEFDRAKCWFEVEGILDENETLQGGEWSMSANRRFLLVAALVCAPATLSAQAVDERRVGAYEDGDVAPWPLSSGRTLALFPEGDVYPVYLADPHRPTNAILENFYTRVTIEDSTSVRTTMEVGGRFGLVRWEPKTPGGRSWQISLDAGIDAQFDSNHKLDNVGWDGDYGLTLTTASSGPIGWKLGVLHVSSHLGDEYAERTGRVRINYTREEVALGISRRLPHRLRAYAEAGVAYNTRAEDQEPWRVQGGLEYRGARRLLGDRFAFYAAADFQSWEERDWRLDTTLQAGILTTSAGKTWRLGAEYSDGRVPLGEFFWQSEARFSLGVWVDF